MTTAIKRVDAGGLAGVSAVALAVMGQIVRPIWTVPGTNATGDQLRAFVQHHRSALQFEMVLNAGAVALWVIFGCGLWLRIRPAAGDRSILPQCLVAGFTGFTSLLLAGFVAFDLLVYRVPDATSARLLYDLTFGLLAMSGLPTAVALGSYAVAVYRHHTMPRYTAHLAALAAGAHVALLDSFVATSGFFSLQGGVIAAIPALLFIWIAATGVVMLKNPRPAQAHDPSPHPASALSGDR